MRSKRRRREVGPEEVLRREGHMPGHEGEKEAEIAMSRKLTDRQVGEGFKSCYEGKRLGSAATRGVEVGRDEVLNLLGYERGKSGRDRSGRERSGRRRSGRRRRGERGKGEIGRGGRRKVEKEEMEGEEIEGKEVEGEEMEESEVADNTGSRGRVDKSICGRKCRWCRKDEDGKELTGPSSRSQDAQGSYPRRAVVYERDGVDWSGIAGYEDRQPKVIVDRKDCNEEEG